MNESNSPLLHLKRDVFADGQVKSKLWLCRELERILQGEKAQTIWTLGGWAGLLPFLLFSRERLKIKQMLSFDQNPLCAPQAVALNNAWSCQYNLFHARTGDANLLNYKDLSFLGEGVFFTPDIIINTAVEHFHSGKWYENIPEGKIIAIQSCDLKHEEHVALCRSEEELKKKFPLKKIFFSGKLLFSYEKTSFSRYMIIGKK